MTITNTTPYGALTLRLALGIMFLVHAGLKIFVFTIAGTVGYFESIGLPGFLAYITILVETLGGLALIAGIFTRFVSLALFPILLGASIFGHGANGWLFTNEGGGWEYPVFLAVTVLVQAMIGDGAYSLSGHLKARKTN